MFSDIYVNHLRSSISHKNHHVATLNNVEIDVYVKFHTATKSSKGGTAIYVNKRFESMERNDLKIITDEFESTWIEVKNKSSKNIVICSIIPRHPQNNFNVFF